jgi:hypothetical protein
MVRDWRSSLSVDPELEARGVRIQAVRFATGDVPDVDDDFRYEFAAAIRREGKKWPRGRYILHTYDEVGALLSRTFVDEHKTLDKALRQLSKSFYAVELSRSELIFEPDRGAGDSDPWEPLEVRVVDTAEPLGVAIRAAKAECHPDFEYNNLVVTRVSARAEPMDGLPLPAGLCVQVTVLDATGAVLTTTQVDLRVGPGSLRPIETELKVYDHQDPDEVVIEAFTV